MKNYFVIAVLKDSNDTLLQHWSNGPVSDLYIPSLIFSASNKFPTKQDAENMIKVALTGSGSAEQYTIIEVWSAA